MRIATTLCLSFAVCLPLSGQVPYPDNPTEVLQAYTSFQSNTLLPGQKTVYRYDLQRNITYEAISRVQSTDSLEPYWVLDQESWHTYSAGGILQNSFVERPFPTRTTLESQYDDQENMVRFLLNRYEAETDELVQSRRTENTYAGNRQIESLTFDLDLGTQLYTPAFQTIFLYDAAGRRIRELSFQWNKSIGDWDSSWQTIYAFTIDQDSSVTYESSAYNQQTESWDLSQRVSKTYDEKGRLLLEISGTEEFGLYRTIRTYDDQTGLQSWRSEGLAPGDSVWLPFFELERTFEDGLLLRSIDRTGWDTTRQVFNSSITQNISYREDGRIAEILQISRWYDPFSEQSFRNEDRTRYEYEFYCDGKLRQEQSREAYTGAPVQYRTTYSYAERPDCAADKAPVSVRAYPSPITNQAPFLRVESAWLSSPGVTGEVVDLMGRRHSSFSGQQSWALDLSVKDLRPGHYFIHLYKDGERRSTKFIKE